MADFSKEVAKVIAFSEDLQHVSTRENSLDFSIGFWKEYLSMQDHLADSSVLVTSEGGETIGSCC